MVNIHFNGSNLPLALLIRTVTLSKWHHVGIEVGGVIYEASATHGVRKVSVQSFKSRSGKHASVSVSCDESRLKAFLEAQLGKDYDFQGAINTVLRRDWTDDLKWYCSELVAAALAYAGKDVYRNGLQGVSPNDLWVISPEVWQS